MTKNRVGTLAALVIATGLALSCMKKPDLNEDDGPEASSDDVATAIVNAWDGGNPFAIQVGEFSYVEKSATIASLPERVTFQEGKTVTSATDSSAGYQVKIVQQIAEISDDNQQKLSTEERIVNFIHSEEATKSTSVDLVKALAKSDVTTMETALPLGIETMRGLMCVCVKHGCDPDHPDLEWEPTCHNLRVTEETEPAPAQVSARQGCEGLANCRLKKRVVTFDLIFETKGDDGTTVRTKAHYTAKVAPEAPYLSRLTDYCFQGLASVKNQKFPVKICQSVKNFRRNGASP